MKLKTFYLLACVFLFSIANLIAEPVPKDSTPQAKSNTHTITITYQTESGEVLGTEVQKIQNDKSLQEFLNSKNQYKEYWICEWKVPVQQDRALTKDDPEKLECTAIVVSQEEYKHRQDSIRLQEMVAQLLPVLRDSLRDSKSAESGSFFVNDEEGGDFRFILVMALAALALAASVVAIVLLVLFHRRNLQQERDRVTNIVIDSHELRAWRDEVLNRFVPAAAPAAAKVSNGEIKDLQNRMAAVEDKLRKSASATANTAPKPQSETQKKVLYADNILGDTFNGVKEHASDDTIFQLTLTGPARAMVTLYENATRKVLANASYLEGCEKQLLGRSTVHIDRNGEAEKDENGRWRVKTRLKVVIR